VTSRSFFPKLIEQPFAHGLHLAFALAAAAAAIGVVASALMGRRYVHSEEPEFDEAFEDVAEATV
jgi:dihydrodipicolinate synthase/N-acetylneuraminate lyase